MIVCFIPEGLPAAVTLVLTIVAKRMYKQKVMVKALATVETFNAVSVSSLVIPRLKIFIVQWNRSLPPIKQVH